MITPTSNLPTIGEYVAIKPGYSGGKPHIVEHRVKVQHVAIWHDRMGLTCREPFDFTWMSAYALAGNNLTGLTPRTGTCYGFYRI